MFLFYGNKGIMKPIWNEEYDRLQKVWARKPIPFMKMKASIFLYGMIEGRENNEMVLAGGSAVLLMLVRIWSRSQFVSFMGRATSGRASTDFGARHGGHELAGVG